MACGLRNFLHIISFFGLLLLVDEALGAELAKISTIPARVIKTINSAQIAQNLPTAGFKVVKSLEQNDLMPSLEKKIKNWYVMTVKNNNKKICYTFTYAFDSIGNHKEARKPYLMAIINGKYSKTIVSHPDYHHRNNSEVNLSIDGEQFTMIGNEFDAVNSDIGTNEKMLQYMAGGLRVMIKSESNIGTYSVDTYLLDGFSEAYSEIKDLCSI